MVLSLGIVSGLVAMLCWGVADFLQALNIKKIGTNRNMFFSNLLGMFPTLLAFAYFFSIGKLSIDMISFIILFIAGLIEAFAVYNFARSFEIGEISIVTPISASYSVLTVILAFLFLGETLPFLKIFSIMLIIIGILLVSTDLKKIRHLHSAKGVRESVMALVGWGVYFFLVGLVSRRLLDSNLAAGMLEADAKILVAINLFFFTSIINGIFMMLLGYLKERVKDASSLKVKNVLFFMIINFFLYTIAWIAVNYGLTGDYVSIVAPVSSLYPALTIILAQIFLKEKLVINQKVGIVVVLSGIVLISL